MRWLLQNESEVLAAVVEFINHRLERNYIDVAGPPPQSDVDLFLLKKAQVVPLPTVRLNLRFVRGNLTGDLGVEVTCSDAHLEEIGRWQVEKLIRQARPKRLFGLTGEHR